MQKNHTLSRILYTVCRRRINNIWDSKSSYLGHNFSLQMRPGSMLAFQRGYMYLPLFWTGQSNMLQVDLQRLNAFTQLCEVTCLVMSLSLDIWWSATLCNSLVQSWSWLFRSTSLHRSLCQSPFPLVAKSNKPWRKYRKIRVQ